MDTKDINTKKNEQQNANLLVGLMSRKQGCFLHSSTQNNSSTKPLKQVDLNKGNTSKDIPLNVEPKQQINITKQNAHQTRTKETKKPSKIDKKAKKQNKKKQSRKSAFIVMVVVALIGVATGLGVGTYFSPKKMDPNRYNFNISALMDNVDEIRAQATNKTPIELGAVKSCALAFDVTSNYPRVLISNYGEVKASGVTQKINSKTIRMGNKFFVESVSVSSFVKVVQRCYIDGNIISTYGGELRGNTVTWDPRQTNTGANDIKTTEQYFQKYSCSKFDCSSFIVSSKTVVNASPVTQNSEGNYEFTLTLDKSKSVATYVYLMRDTGGLKGLPDFIAEPVITVVIDSNYRLLYYHSEERYIASIGITAKTQAFNTNYFYYDEDFEIPKITDKTTI